MSEADAAITDTTILVTCPICNGDRGHEGRPYRVSSDGSAWGDWHTCTYCNGTGQSWEPLYEAPDPDDLDELFNQAFASILNQPQGHTP
jgi:hypothetical protein